MFRCFILCAMAWFGSHAPSAFADEKPAAWEVTSFPEAWRKPPKLEGGFAWYRTWLQIPESWSEKETILHFEAGDQAAEIFLEGKRLGVIGSLPPEYRSGMGHPAEFRFAPNPQLTGRAVSLHVRLYRPSNSRENLNLAAPLVVCGEEAILLAGDWQFTPGDEAKRSAPEPPHKGAYVFSQVMPAAEAFSQWRRLPGEEGRLTPEQSLARLQPAEDLAVELVLAEPEIAQPLSLKFDDRGRLWVMEYRQYPNPAGLTPTSHDRFLRTTYDRVPAAPPNHTRGADRISIHEDTTGSGKFDRHTVFLDGLNLATSFAFDREGVWVLHPPYLLFYPDRNHDDVPDGDPEVHLEGFGLEDSHSLVNSLCMGPDGWLYACQGSTVSGAVRPPDLSERKAEAATVHSLGQLIWRYHPRRRKYEVFAEGGGNTFGLELDSAGRIFSGHNGGDTRGFHYIQGGYYRKGFDKHGPLSNPYTFGYFPAMAHHAVPRFTHTMLLYEAVSLPKKYQGLLFSIAPLQGQVLISERIAEGSTFRTRDLGLALSSNDSWFRPVDIQLGPDGLIYIADFHEQKIDHASHYQGRVAADTGRIYRLRPGQPASEPETSPLLPAEADTSALLEELASANRWRRLSAARRLAWRDDDSLDSRLAESLAASDSHTALEALWLLARRSVLLEKESRIRTALGHTNPQVRAWTIRLLGDDPVALDEAHAVSLAELARTEPNVEVRAQLAATARRLSPKQARPILIELFGRGEDLEDPFLPLLLWWNVERLLTTDLAAELDYWSQSTLWDYPIVQRHISGRLARRLALGGKQRELAGLARLIREAPNAEVRLALRLGFEEAYRDRPLPVLPKELVEALRTAGADSLALRLRQGEEAAIEEAAHRMVSAEKLEERLRYLGLISESGIPAAESILLKATEAGPSSQRAAALRGLASFKSPEVLGAAIAGLQQADTEIREAALGLLALRPEWSKLLINQVDERKIDREIVPPTIRSRIRLHEDDELLGAIDRIWPEDLAQDSTAVVTEVRRLSEIAAAGAGNPYEGRRLFAERCGKCHQLFGTGGEIGPDLTSYQRTDVERILLSILSPSLELREGYEQYLAIDENGRLITGLLVDQDPSTVILRTAEGQTTPLARESLEEFKPLPTSLMPEGLLNEVSPQALRDLIAYLRASQPLP